MDRSAFVPGELNPADFDGEPLRPYNAGADALLLFPAGGRDARDRAGARLGEDAVLDAARAAATGSPDDVVRSVFDRLDAHVGDTPLRDDLTVLAART